MHFFLAAALANLGKLEVAQVATQGGLTLDPAFTIRRFRLGGPESDNPVFLRQRERVTDMMRKAGVPEERPVSRLQLFEQRLGLFQIERIEAFGEPAVDWSEKIAGFIALALVAPEPRHAHRRAWIGRPCGTG